MWEMLEIAGTVLTVGVTVYSVYRWGLHQGSRGQVSDEQLEATALALKERNAAADRLLAEVQRESKQELAAFDARIAPPPPPPKPNYRISDFEAQVLLAKPSVNNEEHDQLAEYMRSQANQVPLPQSFPPALSPQIFLESYARSSPGGNPAAAALGGAISATMGHPYNRACGCQACRVQSYVRSQYQDPIAQLNQKIAVSWGKATDHQRKIYSGMVGVQKEFTLPHEIQITEILAGCDCGDCEKLLFKKRMAEQQIEQQKRRREAEAQYWRELPHLEECQCMQCQTKRYQEALKAKQERALVQKPAPSFRTGWLGADLYVHQHLKVCKLPNCKVRPQAPKIETVTCDCGVCQDGPIKSICSRRVTSKADPRLSSRRTQ